MSVFMVERSLGGISMDDLGGAQRAAIDKGEQMTASGTPVRYIRTTFSPEDGRCMCLFEAQSIEDVKRLLAANCKGIEGVISGRALYDGRLDPKEVLTLLERVK